MKVRVIVVLVLLAGSFLGSAQDFLVKDTAKPFWPGQIKPRTTLPKMPIGITVHKSGPREDSYRDIARMEYSLQRKKPELARIWRNVSYETSSAGTGNWKVFTDSFAYELPLNDRIKLRFLDLEFNGPQEGDVRVGAGLRFSGFAWFK